MICIMAYDFADNSMHTVLTTHRLAYLCCQCEASLGMKLASWQLLGVSGEGILCPVLSTNVERATQIPHLLNSVTYFISLKVSKRSCHLFSR